MGTLSVVPSTDVYINPESLEVTFPENVSNESITYTITYKDNGSCQSTCDVTVAGKGCTYFRLVLVDGNKVYLSAFTTPYGDDTVNVTYSHFRYQIYEWRKVNTPFEYIDFTFSNNSRSNEFIDVTKYGDIFITLFPQDKIFANGVEAMVYANDADEYQQDVVDSYPDNYPINYYSTYDSVNGLYKMRYDDYTAVFDSFKGICTVASEETTYEIYADGGCFTPNGGFTESIDRIYLFYGYDLEHRDVVEPLCTTKNEVTHTILSRTISIDISDVEEAPILSHNVGQRYLFFDGNDPSFGRYFVRLETKTIYCDCITPTAPNPYGICH